MAIINLQCNSPFSNTFKCLLQTDNSMTGRAYIGENLAKIHEEMSELLDKQVNVQKESLKKLPGFTLTPDELRVIDSSNNEGTNSLVTPVNWAGKEGSSCV